MSELPIGRIEPVVMPFPLDDPLRLQAKLASHMWREAEWELEAVKAERDALLAERDRLRDLAQALEESYARLLEEQDG